MEIKNICISYDIDRSCPPKRASVTHVNDVNTRIIELTLRNFFSFSIVFPHDVYSAA